jgi:hypothetical protein
MKHAAPAVSHLSAMQAASSVGANLRFNPSQGRVDRNVFCPLFLSFRPGTLIPRCISSTAATRF